MIPIVMRFVSAHGDQKSLHTFRSKLIGSWDRNRLIDFPPVPVLTVSRHITDQKHNPWIIDRPVISLNHGHGTILLRRILILPDPQKACPLLGTDVYDCLIINPHLADNRIDCRASGWKIALMPVAFFYFSFHR